MKATVADFEYPSILTTEMSGIGVESFSSGRERTGTSYAEAGSLEALEHVQRLQRWKERNGMAPRADEKEEAGEDGRGKEVRDEAASGPLA